MINRGSNMSTSHSRHLQASCVLVYISISNQVVGTSYKSTSDPFQGSQQHLHWPNCGPSQGSADNPHAQQSGPFQGPNQTATQSYQLPFSGPRAKESVYSGQSEDSLFQPITSRFILTNHRPVYSDQSQTTHQPSEPNKRRPPGLLKPGIC